MNRFLFLLFGLVHLAGFGQNKANIKATISYQGQSYQVTTNVPQGYYALTSTGQAAFNAAVKAGVWALTTEDGCIIPAGTKPPKQKPTCSTTVNVNYNQSFAAYQASGSGSTYDKSGASDGKIKDGELTYSVTNIPAPGSYTLVLSYQSNTAVPTAQISVNSGAAQSLQLEATQGSLKTATATVSGFVQGTNSVKITPSGYFASDKITVSRVGSTTVTDPGSSTCNVTLAVNSPSATCGALVQLTATASGSDASGLVYSWRGPNNYVGSGASIAVNAAQANGTYQYTVTASKNGCSKSAVATVTVSGCTTQSETGTFAFQVPTQETGWDGFDNRRLGDEPPHGSILVGNYLKQENERFILYVNEGHGGLAMVYDKLLDRWLINRPDQGRGDGYSSYSGPKSYDFDAPTWHTAFNPLKNGDSGGHGTPISFKSKITINGLEYLYTRSDYMYSWSHTDKRVIKMQYEQWSCLTVKNGTDIVDVHTRLIQNRDDLTDYGPYLQEWALMMVNGHRIVYFYNGDKPYTNDDVKSTDGFEKIVKNNAGQDVWITPGKPMPVSEPWIGVDIGRGRMLAHYNKTLYYPSFNLMNGHEGGDCDGCRTGMYTSGHVMDHLDPKRTWTFDDTWLMGTLDQVRAFVYAQPRAEKPNYYFNQATGRAGWNAFDNVSSPQMPFSINSGWPVTFDGKTDNNVTSADNCKLRSPYTSFKASDCPNLYIKTKLSNTSNSAWKINYTYVGQEVDGFEAKEVDGVNIYSPNQAAIRVPKGVRPPSQFQAFSMQPDGIERVYTIPMNWNGDNYIHQIELQQNATGTSGGAKLNTIYIGCTNPN